MKTKCSSRVLTIDDALAIETFDRVYGPLFDFSPCGTQLAITLTAGIASVPQAGLVFLAGRERGRLHVIDLTTRLVWRVVGPTGYGLFSPVWSPDGRRIATLASNGERICLCVVDPSDKTTKLLADYDLDVPFSSLSAICWIGETDIACRVLSPGNRPIQIDITRHAPETATFAWMQQRGGACPTASVWSTKQVDTIESTGTLASIDADSGAATCFPDESLAPQTVAHFDARAMAPTTFASQSEDRHAIQRCLYEDESTGAALHLIRPDDGSTVLTWRSDNAGTKVMLLECNTHLRDIRRGKVGDLEYTLADGNSAVARYILPPDWCEDERRPAVVFVYPEVRRNVGGPEHRQIDVPSLFNLHLLAARGYVVIEPSLPFDREDEANMIDSLAAGVGPAVAAAVAAGLIDKAHVHVMGHSRGGWAVMALLATTNLFRSGIALAAFSDLLGLHGRLDGRNRYHVPFRSRAPLGKICEDSFALPGPPRHHVDRYIANSPLYLVETIDAPLLMLHGDLDPYPPIEQPEAMFQALQQLGKPAEFVRYWGEEHIFTSPANIQDAFARIIHWLQSSSPIGDRKSGQ